MNITINGRKTTFSGQNITITNGKVIIDGKEANVDEFATDKVFNIVVHGDVDSISGEFTDVTVEGSAGTISTISGDVEVNGDVDGNIKTVSGDVDVNGDVDGNVSTVSGDINN
jgi:DUF4097 and DUF4098 domain-containing protein YvlB